MAEDYVEVTLVIDGRLYSSRSKIKMRDWGKSGEGWDRLLNLTARAAHRVFKRFYQLRLRQPTEVAQDDLLAKKRGGYGHDYEHRSVPAE